MTAACCGRRSGKDGVVDREQVERAVTGRAATLSPAERELAIWRLSQERGWGLSRISEHLSYSRSQVAAVLAKQRRVARP